MLIRICCCCCTDPRLANATRACTCTSHGHLTFNLKLISAGEDSILRGFNVHVHFQIEVIYTYIESLTKDGRDQSLDYKLSNFLVPKDSPDAKIIDELTPVENDILIPKTSCSVFNSTNIEYVLRNLGESCPTSVGIQEKIRKIFNFSMPHKDKHARHLSCRFLLFFFFCVKQAQKSAPLLEYRLQQTKTISLCFCGAQE